MLLVKAVIVSPVKFNLQRAVVIIGIDAILAVHSRHGMASQSCEN